jgi:hypothetical protein
MVEVPQVPWWIPQIPILAKNMPFNRSAVGDHDAEKRGSVGDQAFQECPWISNMLQNMPKDNSGSA